MMAIKAQQHIPKPNLLDRSPPGATRGVPSADLQQQHMQQQQLYLPCSNLMAAVASSAPVLNIGGATVFSEPGSDLTSTSRKRPRGGDAMPPSPIFHSPNVHHHHHQQQQQQSTGGCHEDGGRLMQSSTTSTSGRVAAALSPLGADLLCHLNHHAVEIDALIRVQNERVRIVLDEARKRQRKALLLEAEQQVLRRLREKEAEIERVSRRNAELEEKVRQVAAETQVWLGVARNSEAVAAALRTSLEHALLIQNQNMQNLQNMQNESPGAAMEGCGDTDDDARSVCCGPSGEEEEAVRRGGDGGRCRVCGCGEVCVLVLPCRHLCLCSECESKVDVCPVCESVKNASLQILIC